MYVQALEQVYVHTLIFWSPLRSPKHLDSCAYDLLHV